MAIKIHGNIQPSIIDQYSNDPLGVGAYHLASSPELYEVQRDNNFMFEISLTTNTYGDEVKLRRAGTLDTDRDQVKYFANPDEIIRVSVNKASVPTYSQDPIEVNRGNTSIKYAGKIKFSDNIPIQLYDFIGAEVKDILVAWQSLSGNPYTEKVGHASDYKKEAFLTEYTPDYQIVRRWHLYGCWLSSLSFGDYKYEGGADVVQVNANVTYDKAYIEVSGL